MAKRFQHLCAASRSMLPLCKHLSFDKVAICAKKVALAQEGLELGPADGKECKHCLSVDVPDEKEEPKEDKKTKRGRKKDLQASEKEGL